MSQLPQAQRLGQVLFDVVEQLPAQVGRQPAFDLEAVTQPGLCQQGMVDHLVGHAAGQHALGGLVPVQVHQMAKARGLFGIVEEGAFAQCQFAGFAVEQGDGAGGEALRADVQVGQANLAVDHPGRFMARRQDAQLARRALARRLLAAEGAGAIRQVAGQRVVAGPLILAGIVVIAPQGRSHAITQLDPMLETGMGRAAE